MTTTQTQVTKPTGDTIDDEVISFPIADDHSDAMVNDLVEAAMSWQLTTGNESHRWELETDRLRLALTDRLAERPNRAVARGDRDKIAQWFYNASNDQYADGFVPFERIGKQLRAVMYDFADELIESLTTPTDPAMERDDEQG